MDKDAWGARSLTEGGGRRTSQNSPVLLCSATREKEGDKIALSVAPSFPGVGLCLNDFIQP